MDNNEQRLNALELMRAGIHHKFKVKLRDFAVTLRPLSNSEIMAVYRAVAEMLERQKGKATRIEEEYLMAYETLQLASSSDVGAKDSELTPYILDRMTNKEVVYLYQEYLAVVDKTSPMFDQLPRVEVDRMVEALKKKELLISELSWLQATNILESILSTLDELQAKTPG